MCRPTCDRNWRISTFSLRHTLLNDNCMQPETPNYVAPIIGPICHVPFDLTVRLFCLDCCNNSKNKNTLLQTR